MTYAESVATLKSVIDANIYVSALIVARCKMISHAGTVIQPAVNLSGVCRDPDDDRILECAVAAPADVIETGDRDLLGRAIFSASSRSRRSR